MEKFDKLIYHMILLFIIGGFFGFIFETLGEFFKTGKFVSRKGYGLVYLNQFMALV